MRAGLATGVCVALLCAAACDPKPTTQPSDDDARAAADARAGDDAGTVTTLAGDRPVQIEAGPTHFCARLQSGRIACWGGNQGGRLGDGTLLPSDAPVLVDGIDDAQQLFTGATCATTAAAGTRCWADVDACPSCEVVPGSRLWGVDDAVAGTGASGVPPTPCFVTQSGALRCPGAEQAPPDGLPPVQAVHQGHDYTCIEDRQGELHCYWRYEPARFDPGLPRGEVTAGTHHLCVLGEDARVHCWGDRVRSGHAEPSADGPANAYGPAVEIDDLRARSVVAGYGHTCAITEQDEVVCWGRQSYRSPHNKLRSRWVIELAGAKALAVGHGRACAVTDDGRVHCWGLVDESEHSRQPQPVPGFPFPNAPVIVPSRDSAEQLLAAVKWADTPRRLADIADLDSGVVLGSVRDGKWQPDRTACFADHLQGVELGPKLDGRWSCDDTLTRCMAARDQGATVFRLVDDGHGGRALRGIIDYDGVVPPTEPAAVQAELASDTQGCALWRGLWRRDPALVDDAVTVLHHPANELGDKRGPSIRHLCGPDARRAAIAGMIIDPQAEGWSCDGLQCGYDLGAWSRGVFVFRPDASGQPKLWIVGDDHSADQASAAPLLTRAIGRAKAHKCP